jgi:ERCC4-type nuclease
MARLAVDTRERALMKHLDTKRVPYRAITLPVGDVICSYDEGGCAWVMERKRADDFAASIQDGRWREQTSRMFATGHRVIFCIEGDLRWLGGMHESMLGAIVNSSLRSSCCFRTWDTEETACLVLHVMKKLQNCPPPGISTGGLRPPPQSKRQRAAEAEHVFVRQLMCVPSVSERIAVRLVQHFGDLESLQAALRDGSFPRIQIGDKTFLGKARIATLAKHLVNTGVTK